MKAALATSLALSLASCSWLGANRVPNGWSPPEGLSCTSSPGLVLADILVPAGSIALGNVTDSGERGDKSVLLEGLGMIALPIGIASALTGLVWLKTCRDAKAKEAAWLKSP